MRVVRILLRILLGVVGAIVLCLLLAVLYLSFGDLSRHKGRIERLVSQQIERPFAIEGPFELELVPEIRVHAEKVRLGNAAWATAPQMVEVGAISARVGLRSLLSRPVDIRSLELSDVTVNLEKQADGTANWQFRAPTAEEAEKDEEGEARASALREVPVVVHKARVSNVRVGYRDDKQDERVLGVESFTVATTSQQLLDIAGQGSVEDRKFALQGQIGPVAALLAGRDMTLDLKGSLDEFRLEASGGVAQLNPLSGVDLKVALEEPNAAALLKTLRLPPLARGPLKVTGTLKDADERVHLDLDARIGDLGALVKGTLRTLGMEGADLNIQLRKPRGEQLLDALKLPVVARGAMRIDAKVKDLGDWRSLQLDARLGDLQVKGKGRFRALLAKGTEFTVRVDKGEARELLEALKVPVFASGPLQVDADIKRMGQVRALDVVASVGDVKAKVQGTIEGTSLKGSDIQLEVSAPDAARLGQAFKVKGLPAEPLQFAGRLKPSGDRLQLEGVRLKLADLDATVDGNLLTGEKPHASLRFTANAANLSRVHAKLPAGAGTLSGQLEADRELITLSEMQATTGETRLAGRVSFNRGATPHRVEGDLTAGRLDLTPWLPKPADKPKAESAKAKPPRKYLFEEKPLPLGRHRKLDAKLHLVASEVVLHSGTLRDVDASLALDGARAGVALRARGKLEGTFDGKMTLETPQGQVPRFTLDFEAKDIRSDLTGDGIPAAERPPVEMNVRLQSRGESPRELASNADGRVLVLQGSGKIRKGLVGMFGGDVLAQLTEKLNPFSKADPYTKLECTVARADIVDGKVTANPVMMQSEKVLIAAQGKIDLATEEMVFDFATRPRKGIGISPGMFTNPFLRLEGTLMHPRIGIGAKGLASGAVAAATAGLSVLAEGVLDRARGQMDSCSKALELVRKPAAQ